MSSPDVGILCGEIYPVVEYGGAGIETNALQKTKGFLRLMVLVCPPKSILHCLTVSVWWLDQAQLNCPLNSRPAAVHVEFAVNAFRMGADCAQANYEFSGDLGA